MVSNFKQVLQKQGKCSVILPFQIGANNPEKLNKPFPKTSVHGRLLQPTSSRKTGNTSTFGRFVNEEKKTKLSIKLREITEFKRHFM